MIPRNQWPAALRDFIAGQQTVMVEAVAVCALRSQTGYPVDGAVSAWIRQALAAMRWREGKGAVWRRTAKA